MILLWKHPMSSASSRPLGDFLSCTVTFKCDGSTQLDLSAAQHTNCNGNLGFEKAAHSENKHKVLFWYTVISMTF